MPEVGSVIEDRFELVNLLGGSELGITYEAVERESGERVALKLLSEPCAVDVEKLAGYYETHRAEAAFESINVCAPVALGTNDAGCPYLVTPLLEGRSLNEILEMRDVPLSFSRAVDLGVQILAALQSVHDSGLVHSNLKPNNVFLDKRGDQERVKLLDVGVTEAILKVATPKQRDRIWEALLAEPDYLAPEQVSGDRVVDPRVDLHAMGVLLYRMFTDAHPYRDALASETISRILDETPPRPQSVKPGLAESVEQVILKLMAKDPADRYSSARQAKHALINQARLSGRELPVYLNHREFTGQIPVLDPTELAADDAPEEYFPHSKTPRPRKAKPQPPAQDTRGPSDRSTLTASLFVAASAIVIIVVVLAMRYCQP